LPGRCAPVMTASSASACTTTPTSAWATT
jgi:hypothetical protein